MSGRRVHMIRYGFVAVADREGPGRFEDEDRGRGGRVRLVFRPARDREDRAARQDDRALAGRFPQGDVQFALQDQEELVGVVVDVPDVLALDLGDADVVVVDGGDILTASGSASALDLGLYVVRRDHGTEIANAVSRRLVFAAHRDGGQRQFVERPLPEVRDESLGPLLTWAQERLGEPLTVTDLATRAAVSPATLHRRFRAQLGTTPLAWLTGERVAPACRLIERGEERLDVVAARSGLGTAANLRARVRHATGLSPSAYRRRFGPAPGEPVRA